MWKTIYIAHTEEQAQKIKQMLTENGFLVQLKSQEYQFSNLTDTLVHKLSMMLKVLL